MAAAKKATKKVAKKATKKTAATKTAKAAKAPREGAVTQNGIPVPRAETSSAKIWEIADQLSKSTKKPATRKDVLDAANKAKINGATVSTQYGRWRKFHGLEGRLDAQ